MIARDPAVVDMQQEAAGIARTLLVSDFNVHTLANYLESSDDPPAMRVSLAPSGDVRDALFASALFDPVPHCTVVWTQPHRVIAAFRDLVNGHAVPRITLEREIRGYADLLAATAGKTRLLLVPTWVIPPWQRGLGTADFKCAQGLRSTLAVANLIVMNTLEPIANGFVIDASRWHMLAGRHSFDPKLWFAGKIPFSSSVFAEAAADIRAAFNAQRGGGRRLVVVDLDDTLWGGILGDVGLEGLRLGGHDHQGEAFAGLQQALNALKRRGVLLAIASKNDERVALEAIATHPEMVLRQDDFAAWKINWHDKAANIAELANELGLGLESVVFFDSNPVERARVRAALPTVLVPELPADPSGYERALQSLDCFDAIALTTEDADRAAMYAAERRRVAVIPAADDFDAWLASLQTEVRIERLTTRNRTRTAQLLNKSNQMNLTTRRMNERELEEWAQQPDHQLWTFRVADRFGDAGLVGIASLAIAGEHGRLVDFVVSCRVIGRKVEEAILAFLVRSACEAGAKRLVATYVPTERNRPTLMFLQRSGMTQDGQQFSWRLCDPYPVPKGTTVAGP